MTVLSTIADIATVIGLDVPLAVFSSTEREHVELQSLANRTAKAMAKHYDWQALKTLGTFTGDGTTEDFAYPDGYWRMLNDAQLWTTAQPYRALQHVTSTNTWRGIIVSGLTVSVGQWTIYGSQFHIRPAMATGDTATFYYITQYIVDPVSGSNKVAFTLDTDSFLLDEEVLGLGMIWRWKANKGLPYAEAMTDYEIALADAVGRDKGSKIITIGTQRMPGGGDADIAYPGTIVP